MRISEGKERRQEVDHVVQEGSDAISFNAAAAAAVIVVVVVVVAVVVVVFVVVRKS